MYACDYCFYSCFSRDSEPAVTALASKYCKLLPYETEVHFVCMYVCMYVCGEYVYAVWNNECLEWVRVSATTAAATMPTPTPWPSMVSIASTCMVSMYACHLHSCMYVSTMLVGVCFYFEISVTNFHVGPQVKMQIAAKLKATMQKVIQKIMHMMKTSTPRLLLYLTQIQMKVSRVHDVCMYVCMYICIW